MKKEMYDLLKSWCDKLVSLQINDPLHTEFDGGILCPACGLIHGRCGDSMYPLVYLYSSTGDTKYLECAKKVFDWTVNNCQVGDGIFVNDVGISSWLATTAFTAMQLAEIFIHHKDVIDKATYNKWYKTYIRLVEFVHSDSLFYINEDGSGTSANVNYIFGKLATMEGAYQVTGDDKYRIISKKTADILKNNFFEENGFLFGENVPGINRSPKGYGAIDVGYNVEESLSALAMYVRMSGDKEMKEVLIKSLKAHAVLMLPDGGWDNSWSVRNAKWSYWGSRTSDGCQVAYCSCADEESMFSEVAYRNLMLLKKCTNDGLLYGGPMYRENGYRACVHHTFCHAKSLCWVLDNELYNYTPSKLPCETTDGITFLDKAGIYVVNDNDIRATISCYDFETVPFGHSSGGTLSMLYEKTYGPVLAAGMIRYVISEPGNFQAHRYRDGESNVPGFVYFGKNDDFVSSNDFECEAEVLDSKIIKIKGNICDVNHKKAEGYNLEYEFGESQIIIRFQCDNPEAVFSLPLIVHPDDNITFNNGIISVKNMSVKSNCKIDEESVNRKMFNLTPGFSAIPLKIFPSGQWGEVILKF